MHHCGDALDFALAKLALTASHLMRHGRAQLGLNVAMLALIDNNSTCVTLGPEPYAFNAAANPEP